GAEAEAQAICKRLGQQSRDPGIHGAIASLYTKWGLSEAALAEETLLVRLEPEEDSHLVALGELYFQRGKRERALEIWRHLLTRPGPKPARLQRLAEVYSEHDLAGEAVELYEKALRLAPSDLGLRKGLAQALERMRRDVDAVESWIELLDGAIKA